GFWTDESLQAVFSGPDAYFNRAPTILGLPPGTQATPDTFVRALYQQVIGRPPGPQDPIPLLDQIASTQAGRQALASGLLHSVPYDKILVDGYFTTFPGRPPP